MKRRFITTGVIGVLLCILMCGGCSNTATTAAQSNETENLKSLSIAEIDKETETQIKPTETEKAKVETETVILTTEAPETEIETTELYIEEEIEYVETEAIAEEEVSYSYGDYAPSDLQYMGVLNWGGWRWTYYSQRVLPGGGLNIPGRYVDENGFVCDGNGYICLASGSLGWGTVVDTPFGKPGCVYDSGCAADTLDVYCDW